jgi:hypothetical protein
MRTGWEPSESFPSALARPFSAGLAVFPAHRSSAFSGRGSSSLELSCSFSVHVRSPARRAIPSFGLSTSTRVASERLPWGFVPLRGRQSAAALVRVPVPRSRVLPRVTPAGTCSLEPSALGVSHALDGLLRYRSCEPVSSRCHVQGFAFRGLSLAADTFRISPNLSPPVVGQSSLRCDPRQPFCPRLQGFSPRCECGDLRIG